MNFDLRLLRLLIKSKWAFAITIALGLTGGALAIWQASLFAQIVNCVFLKQQGFQQVYFLLITLLVVIILRALSTWGNEKAGSAISNPIKRFLRHKLYQHLIQKGPVFSNQESTGELVNTAVEGVEALDAYYSQYIPQVILAVFIPLSFLIFVARVDWVSALVMLLTAPLIPFFMALIGYMAQAMTRRQWLSLSRMSAYFLDVLQGLTTLKTLGRSREQGEVIDKVSRQYAQTTMGVLRVAFLSALTLELVATLSTAVVAVQLGLRLLYGWISFEQALFVLALAPEYYLTLRMLGTRFHAGIAGVEAGKRIFHILGEGGVNEQISGVQASVDEGIDEQVIEGDLPIIFKNVYFGYEQGQGAINGINFTINPGKKIALVGSSGAGKSTLTLLLMGFLKPTKGDILVGDKSLSELSIQSWRKQIAWVPQKPYLFMDSVAANIRLANPAANDIAVMKAAQTAHADEFIQDLPQGFKTVIGERGTRLSAGQAQRIALARAFLKNAPILILDEGTTHLDKVNAGLVQDSIRELMSNRTTIIIAHQLSTVMQADCILVMDKGRIVQSGTHAELAQQDGLYRKLLASEFSLQEEMNEIGNTTQVSNPPQFTEKQLLLSKSESRFSDFGLSSSPYNSPFTLLSRLIRLISPYSGWIMLSAFLGFATIASGFGLAATSAYIISAAALQPSIAVLQVAIVGVRFFGLSRGVFRYLERYVSHKVTLQVLGSLRVWFYEALEPLAPANLWRKHSGDLLSRIISDISSLENFYVRALYPPLVAALVAGLIGFYLGIFSIKLVVPVIVLFLGGCVGISWLMKHLARNPGKVIITRRAVLHERLVEGIQGMADILIYGQAQCQAKRIDEASSQLEASHQAMAILGGLQSSLIGLTSNLSLWIVLWLAIPLIDSNLIPGVYLASMALATLAGFEAATPLPAASQYLESNLQATRRLFELVDTKPEVVDLQETLPLPERFDLEVMDLTFAYPVEDQIPMPLVFISGKGEEMNITPVIKNLSLSLPQGKRLTILGPSGTGKTTLIHLLLRFWDYQEGIIKLGGHDIRSYRQDDLRKIMAVVPQNTYLFNTTLRENLLLARSTATDEQLYLAIHQAQLEDLLKTLPQGLDTWLGEQGVRLSAGERQRVAIARALLRDSPILILDEATANLDAQTERKVLQAIDKAARGKTVIMITHTHAGWIGGQVMEM